MYQRQVMIRRELSGGEVLKGFVVLIALRDEALKTRDNGGQVASASGGDIHFLTIDGAGALANKLVAYDGAAGTLWAYVRITEIGGENDTVIVLACGDDAPVVGAEGSLWDDDHVLVRQGCPDDAVPVEMPDSGAWLERGALTVEAWVEAADERAEVLQAVVSKWEPDESFDRFAAFDAGDIDGVNWLLVFL